MIAHHGKGQTIDGEDRGEKLKSMTNPGSPVIEGSPGQRIFTTEKGASNTTMNAVYQLNQRWVDDLTTSLPSHEMPLLKVLDETKKLNGISLGCTIKSIVQRTTLDSMLTKRITKSSRVN